MDDRKTLRSVPEVDQGRCILCCACRNACLTSAVAIERGRVSVDAAACDGCGACIDACVPGALRVSDG